MWGDREKRHLPLLLVTLMILSCSPGDDERCGDGYVFKDNTCVPVDGDSDDTETQSDADAGLNDPDGGLPEGMGQACTGEGNECDGLEADYCAINPMTQNGYCTSQGCSPDSDDCPSGFLCCEFPPSIPSPTFCATEDDYAAMGSMCEG